MKNKRGFTLVELIVSLLVIGIVMSAALAIFINAGFQSVNVDVYTTAQTLAEYKMEQAMSHDFADVNSEAVANFSGDFSLYSSQVIVDFVSSGVLDTVSGTTTNFKRIVVKISHPQITTPYSLEAVRVNY